MEMMSDFMPKLNVTDVQDITSSEAFRITVQRLIYGCKTLDRNL